MPTRRRSTTAPRDQRRPPLDQPTMSPDDDLAMATGVGPEPAADDGARRRRIAERAYRRAERRGFAPGQELDDWLARGGRRTRKRGHRRRALTWLEGAGRRGHRPRPYRAGLASLNA